MSKVDVPGALSDMQEIPRAQHHTLDSTHLRSAATYNLNLRLHMQGDFTVIMKTLQRYPPLDVNILLEHASKLPPCSELGLPLGIAGP